MDSKQNNRNDENRAHFGPSFEGHPEFPGFPGMGDPRQSLLNRGFGPDFGGGRGGRGHHFPGPQNWDHFGDFRRGRGFHGGDRGRGFHGPRGGDRWRRGFDGPRHWMSDSLSDTSSDSESDGQQEQKRQRVDKESKKCQKQVKNWQRMRNWMSGPIDNRSHCTICLDKIKPLVDTEVLECGHIYHRLCLKEYFQMSSAKDTQKAVICVQCKQQIDDKLMAEFKKRFHVKTSDGKNIPQEIIVEDSEDMGAVE